MATEEEGPALARRLWTLFEPVHAVAYFHPTVFATFEEAGLRGFWRGYFAGRAAPLGRVGEAPVRAAFFGFSASMTARALPGVWDLITPEQALRARAAGAGRALREMQPDVAERDAGTVADGLWAIASALPGDGRVLGAANVVLPRPDDAFERLWQAATNLREHRGDGHVAALTSAALTGLEALILRAAADLDRAQLQRARGWTDEDWVAAGDGLAARGLLAGGQISATGRRILATAEERTDVLAWDGWTRAGGTMADARRLAHELHPHAVACRALLPAVNPIGLPEIGSG